VVEQASKAINRLMDFIDRVGVFFNGFGDLLIQVLVVWLIYGLFYFMIPKKYQLFLRFNTLLCNIIYAAKWLLTK
jgi:hypothetical protein